MSELSFEQYLLQADAAAQKGDWAGAIRGLEQAEQLQPTNTMVATALGSCLIQAGDVGKSIRYFERAAELSPDVFEAHNNLGVALTLAGQFAQAEKSYRKALEIDSENLAAWKNLAQACLQQDDRLAEGAQILASIISAFPDDVDALLMLANLYEEAGELNSAETLYDRSLVARPDLKDALVGKARIAQIRSRQVRIARPEHARKLAALKGLKKPGAVPAEIPAPSAPAAAAPTAQKTIGYTGVSSYSGLRLKRVFQQLGLPSGDLNFRGEFDPVELRDASFVVFSQPNLSSNLLNGVRTCVQDGRPYAIDLEQDFHHMPADHPAYAQFGPGNPNALPALETVLANAAWVSVPSAALADVVRPYCKEARLVLPGWDGSNPQWQKPRSPHAKFQIGWIGTAAERADLLSIKLELVRFLKENLQAVLVIAGDMGAFEAFGSLSEKQKLFLPAAEAEEMPYLLGQFDALIVPWRDIPYNRAKSDLPLVEAAARGIPWVASAIPSYRDWGVGGLLAEKPGDWLPALRQVMASKPEQDTARQKAQSRKV